MARYIDADLLMKEFCDFVRPSNNSDFAPVPTWNDAVSLVGSAPTADVVERKQGTWIFEDRKPVNRRLKTNEFAYCDQCGGTAPGYPFWEGDLELTTFCPHCGARML